MKLMIYLVIAVTLPCLPLFVNYSFEPDKMQNFESGKKIKVFILAGQSNMEGRADANNLLPSDLLRLSKVKANVKLAFNYEPVCPLNVVNPSPEIAEIYKSELIFGPELFFGIVLSEAWPDEKILLIKLTEGATSLYGSWNPEWSEDKAAVMGEEKGTKLYNALIEYVDKTLYNYTKDEYEICAMLWVQGETDTENQIAAAEYGLNLQQFINHIRKDLGNVNLPFLLFQVGNAKVIEGMIQTAKLLPHVTVIPQSQDPTSAEYYPKLRNGHLNHEGIKKLGQCFGETFLKSIREAK